MRRLYEGSAGGGSGLWHSAAGSRGGYFEVCPLIAGVGGEDSGLWHGEPR